MSWREKVVVKILLLVARVIAYPENRGLAMDIYHLSNHISVSEGK